MPRFRRRNTETELSDASYRWSALLPGAMAAATLLYSLLAVLASPIIEDLGITRAQLGLVLGTFSVVAALLSPAAGRIVDVVGARPGMLAVFAIGAVGFTVLGGADRLGVLIGAGMVLGIAQALANPATNKMIAFEVAPGRRGLMTGVKQSGVQAGTFVGGLAFPALESRYDWQAVALIVSAAIATMFLAGLIVLPSHPRHDSVVVVRGDGQLPAATRWITAYAFFMGLGGAPIFSFFPLYANEEIGVSESMAGVIVAVAGLVGVVARIAWSIVAERRGEFTGPMLAISSAAVVSTLLLILAEPLGIGLLWLAALLGWMSISAWNSVAMLAVIVDAGPRLAGRASGIVLFGFISGLAIAPPVFGWSVDELGTYTPGLIVVAAIFVAAFATMAVWRRRAP